MDKREIAAKTLAAAARLARETGRLEFGGRVAFVYKPLEYAWEPHSAYIQKYCTGPKKYLFLGMNPGPWGMAQTGIPFGEITAVKDWLEISGRFSGPARQHPRKPIHGFDCRRSEVSGNRLWGLIKEQFGTPEKFFREHFVVNYCPLIFLEEGGKNLTPDKLPASEREALYRLCDAHLAELIALLEPRFVIGIGKFAEKRASVTVKQLQSPGTAGSGYAPPLVSSILHPSPASPAANRGWANQARSRLVQLGVW
jgi:single-strand selective monofunctional uracil DNA glycosylase